MKTYGMECVCEGPDIMSRRHCDRIFEVCESPKKGDHRVRWTLVGTFNNEMTVDLGIKARNYHQAQVTGAQLLRKAVPGIKVTRIERIEL